MFPSFGIVAEEEPSFVIISFCFSSQEFSSGSLLDQAPRLECRCCPGKLELEVGPNLFGKDG